MGSMKQIRLALLQCLPGDVFQDFSEAESRSSGHGHLWVHAAHLVNEGVRLKQKVRAEAAKGNFRGKGVAVIFRRLVNGPELSYGVVHDGGEDGRFVKVFRSCFLCGLDDADDGQV